MNKRKDPPLLEDVSLRHIRKMFNGAAIKWTDRIHKDAETRNRIWVQHIKMIDEECIEVYRRLGSFPMPEVLEILGNPALTEVTNAISSYNRNVGSRTFTTPLKRHIYENICQNMLKSVLFPCTTRYNIGIVKSVFMQGILINLLYVVPNIKILVLPAQESVTYTSILMERIRILHRLEEFEFELGCTSVILIQLSKYCLRLKKISVESSKNVNDSCVEHLLNLRCLISLNISGTLITSHGYAQLLSGLPEIRNISGCSSVDQILKNVTVSLPSVKIFMGTVSTTRFLVQKCPNIRKLTLICSIDNPSGLGELKNVVDLSIYQDRDTPVILNPLVSSLGPNFTSLLLFGIVTINIDVIINYCSCLKQLTITYSNVECGAQGFNCKSAHFQNVNNLRLAENFGPFNFNSILHLYIHLNVLDATKLEEMSDDVIRRIISFGGFRYLSEILIEDGGYLSMESVLLLLNCCPNLTKIGHIRSWSGIPEIVAWAFKAFVQTHNLALSVGI